MVRIKCNALYFKIYLWDLEIFIFTDLALKEFRISLKHQHHHQHHHHHRDGGKLNANNKRKKKKKNQQRTTLRSEYVACYIFGFDTPNLICRHKK